VFGDLAEAVRRESATALCSWWGVTGQTVRKWRRALGVGAITEGTSQLRRDHSSEPLAEGAREKARARARDPELRARIAAAMRGKPRPAHVIEAVAAAHRGTSHGAEARRKMSATHRRRGTRPPKAGPAWGAWEDEAVRTLPAAEAARRTGRTLTAVYSRRRALEMPDGRRREG
jgi:hypothetical protein